MTLVITSISLHCIATVIVFTRSIRGVKISSCCLGTVSKATKHPISCLKIVSESVSNCHPIFQSDIFEMCLRSLIFRVVVSEVSLGVLL